MSKPLNAGPELDAAVARALGWDFTINEDGDVELLGEYHGFLAPGDAFEPSSDVEAAMLAADECDLFMRFDLSKTRLYWQMFEFQSAVKYGEPRDDIYVTGTTAAVVISRAIVKMFSEVKKPA